MLLEMVWDRYSSRFLYKWYELLNDSEIAEALGCSSQAVANQKQREGYSVGKGYSFSVAKRNRMQELIGKINTPGMCKGRIDMYKQELAFLGSINAVKHKQP